MQGIAMTEGVRSGLLLGGLIVALALLGIAPAFSRLPEVPLVALAVAVPVVAYVLTGFRAQRKAGRLGAAALAGAVAGAISGTIAGLSYLVFNQIFFDTVSKQSEKILGYHASGLDSMRTYLLVNGVTNVVVGLVLGTLGGALLGAVGGLLHRLPFGRA